MMAAQLDKLAEASELPNVTLRVVPYSAGYHPGLIAGSFTILRFPLNGGNVESEPPTVYSESFTGALYLDKTHEVERYSRAFGEIWSVTLWRKSTYSNGQGACVEVGTAARAVLVRDTTNRSGATLNVSAETWRALLTKLRAS